MAEGDTSHVERMQDYRRQLPTDARLLYDDLIANNVTPRIAAAAALYTHKLRAGEDVSQTAIGEQYDTTQTTISRWFRWLLDHSDDIGRCDLDIDFDSGSHAPTSSYAPESPARSPTDAENTPQSYSDRLQGYRDDLPTDARPLYDDLVENSVGARSAAAAARYTHGLLVDEDITQADIAEQYDTSSGTIRKWFHWLVNNSDHIDSDQPPTDTEAPPSTPLIPRCVHCGTVDVTIHDWSDGKRVDCQDCNHSQFWVTNE